MLIGSCRYCGCEVDDRSTMSCVDNDAVTGHKVFCSISHKFAFERKLQEESRLADKSDSWLVKYLLCKPKESITVGGKKTLTVSVTGKIFYRDGGPAYPFKIAYLWSDTEGRYKEGRMMLVGTRDMATRAMLDAVWESAAPEVDAHRCLRKTA